MRNIILGSTAIMLGMIATSAAAQYSPNPNVGYGNHQYYQHNAGQMDTMSMRIGQLQARLDEGVRMRSITRREARPIREEIRRLVNLERQYSWGGISGQERAALQQRINVVRQQLRRADDGARGRYAHWDRDDGYSWATHNNGWTDANRDGWDDRDYNRNGRWDDDVNYGYQQQQQRYGYPQQYGYQHQQQPAQPTGIAGLISSILGGGGGLQVGQQAPSGLYGVPYQHQNHYRDGNGVYYRSDGRQIYQIDARTHVVARVFPV